MVAEPHKKQIGLTRIEYHLPARVSLHHSHSVSNKRCGVSNGVPSCSAKYKNDNYFENKSVNKSLNINLSSQSKPNLSPINRTISSSTRKKCNISTNQHCNVLYYDSNHISVIVAGYNTEAMIDTGSYIRAISSEMF